MTLWIRPPITSFALGQQTKITELTQCIAITKRLSRPYPSKVGFNLATSAWWVWRRATRGRTIWHCSGTSTPAQARRSGSTLKSATAGQQGTIHFTSSITSNPSLCSESAWGPASSPLRAQAGGKGEAPTSSTGETQWHTWSLKTITLWASAMSSRRDRAMSTSHIASPTPTPASNAS
jgi:hypothetical protein